MSAGPAPSAAEAVIETACALDAAGLMPNKSGNVSVRTTRGFLITPAAVPYVDLTPSALVEIEDGDPEVFEGNDRPAPTIGAPAFAPSSEWRLHAAIYRAYGQVGAIVHTHSPKATALACAGVGLPPFHYMIALAGGEVRCAPYATFGTAELAAHAVAGLAGRRATLLANHGMVSTGPTLGVARAVALEVENLAGQYLALRAASLEPRRLDEDELARVIGKFAGYGRLG